MVATGSRTQHDFFPALPPLIVTPSFEVAPTITIALKPVYSMRPQTANGQWSGQPLSRVSLATIPNGLLLTQNPDYLRTSPGLFFPGKDDADKDPRKRRARVSFDVLQAIDAWRYQDVWVAP
jgi:hypothetical protein